MSDQKPQAPVLPRTAAPDPDKFHPHGGTKSAPVIRGSTAPITDVRQVAADQVKTRAPIPSRPPANPTK